MIRSMRDEGWIKVSTTSYSDVGEDGYGCMWWIDLGEGEQNQ
jgi:hypothetical protein